MVSMDSLIHGAGRQAVSGPLRARSTVPTTGIGAVASPPVHAVSHREHPDSGRPAAILAQAAGADPDAPDHPSQHAYVEPQELTPGTASSAFRIGGWATWNSERRRRNGAARSPRPRAFPPGAATAVPCLARQQSNELRPLQEFHRKFGAHRRLFKLEQVSRIRHEVVVQQLDFLKADGR